MMYLGIDCGTQGTKAVLFTPYNGGQIVGRGYAAHDLISDATGRREQKAEWWIDALIAAVRSALEMSGRPASEVAGIAVSGQHHGLVMLDEAGQVIRDVKLWNDTQTADANAALIEAAGGPDGIWERLGTTLPVGYTASKLAWVRQHEPEVYARMRHVLLPHDYLNYWLTNAIVMEAGEASGTGFFDVVNRRFSPEMIALIDPDGLLDRAVPPLVDPLTAIDVIRPEVAAIFGFRPDTIVACGSGDNVMGAIGTGSVRHGRATLGLGTSGVLNLFSERPVPEIDRSLQVFCGVEGGWIPTTATMNATPSTELFRELFKVPVGEVDTLIASAPAGAGGIRMLPFFNGERRPSLPKAKGSIFGLDMTNCTRPNLMRASAEAVAMVLKYGYRQLPVDADAQRLLRLTGGGANSAAWRQIIADVFDTPAVRVKWDEGGAFGAALLALAVDQRRRGGTDSLADICDRFVALDHDMTAEPDPANVRTYESVFDDFMELLQREHGVVA